MARLTKILVFLLCFPSLSARAQNIGNDIPAPQALAPTPGFSIRTAANYYDLRHTIVELIASSKKRVWLLTDYLSDGEIASALYLSKHRKYDVKVFFGRDRLNGPGSRLLFLKTQGVQVYIRPKHGFVAPTLLFIDQRLYTVNRDLNGTGSLGSFEIVQASPEDVKNFVVWLRGVMEYPEIAVPRYAPRSPGIFKEPFQGDSEGSYNYDRGGGFKKAPDNVSRELPKQLKWKKIQEERENKEKEKEAPSQPATPDIPAALPGPEAQPGPATPEGEMVPVIPLNEEEAQSPPSAELAPDLKSGKPPKSWTTPEPAPDSKAGPTGDEDRPSDPPKEEQ